MACKKYTSNVFTTKSDSETTPCNKGFNNVKNGTRFEFKRPAFDAGTLSKETGNVPRLTNIRRGIGNRSITRNNFLAPPIKGREVIDFEKLQAQDISDGGIKVQFGDKTIDRLFKVQVEDITDVEWLDEYQRRSAAGETAQELINMPPLGRSQRQVSKMKNFGDNNSFNSINDKIELLSAVVRQSNTENKMEVAQLVVAVAQLLTNIDDVRDFTVGQFNQLRVVINRLNIPKNYRVYGFTHRIFGWNEYRAQQGFINLFLLSNVSNDRSLEQPLISVQTDLSTRPMNITSLVGALQRPGANKKYLDVASRTVITRQQAYDMVNDGVDGGLLDGQPAPGGVWV